MLGGPTVQTHRNGGHFRNGIYTLPRLLRTREVPLVGQFCQESDTRQDPGGGESGHQKLPLGSSLPPHSTMPGLKRLTRLGCRMHPRMTYSEGEMLCKARAEF
jgi:hypothetical protein